MSRVRQELLRKPSREISSNAMGVVMKQHFSRSYSMISSQTEMSLTRRLRTAAVAKFRSDADKPETNPDFKLLAKSFKLPDPRQSPEMYRVCRLSWWRPWKRKLVIIWGVEDAEVGAIHVTPENAVTALQPDPWENWRKWQIGRASCRE